MVMEVRTEWDGTTGGTGVTVMHFADTTPVDGILAAVRTFWASLASLLPNEVTVRVQSEVRSLNVATGVLTDVETGPAQAAVAGTYTGVYAMPAGLRIDWETGQIVAGRRVTGRTYVVPAGGLEQDGTPSAAAITQINNAATALLGATPLVVWSRTHGVQVSVQQALVANKAAVLRGRRD